MKNNLSWLIAKKELSILEFGKAIFPEMKCETKSDKVAISQRASRLSKQTAKIPLQLLDPISELLGVDYNQMLGYGE